MLRRIPFLLLGLVLVIAAFSTGEPFLFYLLVCLLYLGLTAVSQVLLNRLNQRFSLGVRHAEL